MLKACSDTAWLGDLDQPAVKSCEKPRLGPLVLGLETAPNLRPLPKLQICLCQACSFPILTLPCGLDCLTQSLTCPVPTHLPGSHPTVTDPSCHPWACLSHLAGVLPDCPLLGAATGPAASLAPVAPGSPALAGQPSPRCSLIDTSWTQPPSRKLQVWEYNQY